MFPSLAHKFQCINIAYIVCVCIRNKTCFLTCDRRARKKFVTTELKRGQGKSKEGSSDPKPFLAEKNKKSIGKQGKEGIVSFLIGIRSKSCTTLRRFFFSFCVSLTFHFECHPHFATH